MTAGPHPVTGGALPAVPDEGPVHRAAEPLAGSATARIVLGNRVYTLRLTRAGKLILTR